MSPYLPTYKCQKPGCNQDKIKGSPYCKGHNSLSASGWGKGRYETDPIYQNKKWKNASKRYRRKHPLCECKECTKYNRTKPAHHVDHIIPWKSGNTHEEQMKLFWKESNWQSINKNCHARKSAQERNG